MVPQMAVGRPGGARPHGGGRGGPLTPADPPAEPGREPRGARLAVCQCSTRIPQNGQKKMLLVFGSFLAIFVIIAIIATIASP